ncbi:cuticle protein 8-like [Panulirus ornatus]|uniref:cuticle protein 8-like n=1 Tax=Panulirus ornatus TaxID=150431 RepID=UPI003A87420A
MYNKIFLMAALLVVASAEIIPIYSHQPVPYEPPKPSYHDNDYDDPNYSFQWKVDDQYAGNYYGHEETRDGYDTEGTYFVRLSDGRLMTVNYEVHGDSGFLADVNYEGEAHYPTYPHEPTYRPPHGYP